MEERRGSFSLLAMLFILSLVLLPFFGSYVIFPHDIFGGASLPQADYIFWQLRVPRVLLAALAGAGFAVSGLVVQSILRNPLATPYTLGITSGSGLGAVIAIKGGLEVIFFGFSSLILFSFSGALFTAWLIYLIASRMRRFSSYLLILIGIILAYAFGAASLFIQFFSDWAETRQIVRWFMGGIQPVGYRQLAVTALIAFPAMLHIYRKGEELNIMLLGEELAGSKGIDVRRETRKFFFAVTVIIAIIVSVTGPIGFVGIVIPHLMRLWAGPDNRELIPLSLLGGAVFLMFSDTLARVVMAPAELPVGIITAIIGAVFFIFLLYFRREELFGRR